MSLPLLTPEQRAVIRARADAATDGPWSVHDDHHIVDANENFIAGNYDYEIGGIILSSNCEFAAAARTDVPALLDHADAADKEIARFREHSTWLNTIGWKIAEALGEVPEGSDRIDAHPIELAKRLIAEFERLQFEQKEWQRLHAQITELQVDLDACRAERDDRLARFTRLALGSDGRGLPDNTLIPVAEIRAAILEPIDAAIAKRAEVAAIETYLVVCPQLVGPPDRLSYTSPLPMSYFDRTVALREGLKELGHDDFCIATLRDGKLFAYGPSMTDWHPVDRDSLTEIARQLYIDVHPDAVDGGEPAEAGDLRREALEIAEQTFPAQSEVVLAEEIDDVAMAKFEQRLMAAFEAARADMAADIDVEAELAKLKARAAAWYPNARCTNPARHEAHPWGDPIHWCEQVSPS